METVRIDMLKAIRGRLSQNAVSRLMGYSYNQVYRWESGHTQLPWSEFARLCEACKIDLSAVLKSTLKYSGDPLRSDSLLKFLFGDRNVARVSRSLGLSRFVLMKWMKGSSEPTLDWVLDYLHRRDLLLDFVNLLVTIDKVESLAGAFLKRKKQLELVYSEPLTSAIFLIIELKQYRDLTRHEKGFIACQLGISQEEEARLLAKLLDVGLLRVEGKKFQRNRNFRSSMGFQNGEKQLLKFWIDRALASDQALSRTDGSFRFGYSLFALGEESYAKLDKAYEDFVSTATKIVLEDDEKDIRRVRAIAIQSFDVTRNHSSNGPKSLELPETFRE